MRDEQLVERSAELGAWLLAQIRTIAHPSIKAVRGRGLMIAIELHEPARTICEALKERGMLCKETHDTVIRFAPPLVIGQSDIDWVLERIAPILQN